MNRACAGRKCITSSTSTVNPVRRGLVSRAVDWPWSSARTRACYEDALVSIDRTIPTTAERLVGWP